MSHLLDAMIGDANTLLPETLDDGSVPSIPSCWATPPPFFEATIASLSRGLEDGANDFGAPSTKRDFFASRQHSFDTENVIRCHAVL